MLAHVGSCWGHVGLRWPQVGLNMAQDRSMLAQVGPKMPKMVPKASQVPQDEPKMASRWPPNRYVLAPCSFFHDFQNIQKRLGKSCLFKVWEALNASHFRDFLWSKF